jgi:hypothetical protein
MSLLVRDGQTAPGAGAPTFNVLGGFALNNASEYVLVANLNTGGSVTSQNDAGLWAARGGNPMLLFVREADHAPGTNAADGFSTFSSLRLNEQGRIAFQGTVAVIPGQTDPGLTTLNDGGIWSEGAAGLELIARENDPAPGVPAGVLFDFFSAPAMNATGRLAFLADLRGAGVTTANNTGLWAQDDNGALTLLLREGDSFDVDDGPGTDMRTVSQIGFWSDGAGEDGARTGLNEVGQLVFSAAFTDSSTGVIVVDLRDNLPGDFNTDGQVDAADYVIWRKGLGTTYTQDGYTHWRSHFGQTAASGSATSASAAIPEPLPHAILITALLAMCATSQRDKLRNNH